MVNHLKDDDAGAAESQDDVAAPLWPRAADGRSGMRGKDHPAFTSTADTAEQSAAPYRLLSPLPATAYGAAFRALDVAQNREVAVHYLPLPADGESAIARQIPLSVAKCAQLSHPNVVALEEHGRDARTGAHFVVTEPLEGASLSAILDDLHTLPLVRALNITLQMGRALRAAHKLGVVHGALTPASVRLVESDSGERVRVVGFGALMIAPPELRVPKSVSEPQHDHVAPERLSGADEPPTASGDVFALASVLFQMLTGAAPRVGEEVPRLSLASVEPVPRDLEELMLQCLQPRPEQRTSDLVSLLRKLREIARSVDGSAPFEGRRGSWTDSSLPPAELPSAEGDSSGSLFSPDSPALRQGALWILAGLLLALAAVWLLWHASSRGGVDPTPVRPGAVDAVNAENAP